MRLSATAEQRCCQCGRVGTRGFFSTADTTVEIAGEQTTIPSMTFCSNTTACRKRWPKEADHDE